MKYLPIVFLITGCTSTRDQQLFSVGVIVFGLYLIGLIITFLIPAIHHSTAFQKVIELIRQPARYLATITIITGLVILTSSIIIYEQSMTFKLIPLLGGVVIVAGQCLSLWSNNNNQKQDIYAKAIAINIGCIIGLIYIISGASNLKF